MDAVMLPSPVAAGVADCFGTNGRVPGVVTADSSSFVVGSVDRTCRTASAVRITGFSLEEFSIPMMSPLQLSLCRLTERRGVLVRLEGKRLAVEGQGPVLSSEEKTGLRCGVGEVTPLPGEQIASIR